MFATITLFLRKITNHIMKSIKIIIVAVFIFTVTGQANAQFFQKLANGDWIVGAGWNIVDDNGQKMGDLFGQGGSWSMLGYPSSVRVEKNYNAPLSFVFLGAYNQYSDSKVINGEFHDEASTFLSFDLNAKYNFMHLYNVNTEWFGFETDVFDIYGSFGGGFTHRSTNQVGNQGTVNLGVGMNAFVYKNWGFNIDATAKFAVQDFWHTAANYTHYSIGVLYKLKSSKRLYGGSSRNRLKE